MYRRARFRFSFPLMKKQRSTAVHRDERRHPSDALLRRDGALTIRDIRRRAAGEGAFCGIAKKPSKFALQLAFYTGVVDDFRTQRDAEDLRADERHFGWDKPPKPAVPSETPPICSDRALRSQGSSASIRSATSTRRARPRSGN